MPIIKAGTANLSAPIKVLIYGDSGAGKTTLAASSPRPLFLLTERQGVPSISAENPDALIMFIETADHLRQAILQAKTGKIEGQTFDTLIVDSLTEAQRMVRDEILIKSRRTEMTLQDWGKLADKTRALIRALRDLPCPVVCTALMEDQMIEGTGQRNVYPLFAGKKTKSEIAQWFTIIGCLYRKDAKVEDGKTVAERHLMLDASSSVLSRERPSFGWSDHQS